MVAGRSVAVAVVAFSPRFAFLSMTACCETQREAADVKIARRAWWNPKTRGTQYAVARNSGLTRKDSERDGGHRTRTQGVDAETQRETRGADGAPKAAGELEKALADDVAVSWGNADSGERKRVLKYEEHSHHQDGVGRVP